MTEPIPVRVRECPDGTHPDGDVVYVAPKLSLDGGLVATYDAQQAGSDASDLFRRWLGTFVRFGAIGWNLHDDDGPMPFDVNALLEDASLGLAVANVASDLYMETLTGPLAVGSPRPSRNGQTASSTSTPKGRTSRRRGSSSPSPTAGRPSRVPTP